MRPCISSVSETPKFTPALNLSFGLYSDSISLDNFNTWANKSNECDGAVVLFWCLKHSTVGWFLIVSLRRNHGCAPGFLKNPRVWGHGSCSFLYCCSTQKRDGQSIGTVTVLFFSSYCSGLKHTAFQVSYQNRDTLITSKTVLMIMNCIQ